MDRKGYKSVFDLEGSALEAFLDKYGDIFEPTCVDLEYYKLYYQGKYDPMIKLFDYLKKTFEIKTVVYPGSFIHVAPSYVFPHVTYLDVYPNIESFFVEEEVVQYLEYHKFYEEENQWVFQPESYMMHKGTYDLVISSNAGSISIDCKHLMHSGTFLVVNNGHSDADNAFDDPVYEYIGCFNFSLDQNNVTLILGNRCEKSDTYYLFKYK